MIFWCNKEANPLWSYDLIGCQAGYCGIESSTYVENNRYHTKKKTHLQGHLRNCFGI